MNDLEQARKIISETDDAIAKLFVKRMNAVKAVAEYKQKHGLPIYDKSREEDILSLSSLRVGDSALLPFYINFVKSNMEISKRYQRLLLEGRQVAYCGTEGAFAYIAADHVFPGCTKVAYPSFAEAYKAVVSGECDSVVLPVENSFAGDVGSVMDLMFSGDLVVTAMYDLPVVHDLLGTPDATIEDITTVVSHPQALSQCSGFIKSKGLRETQFSNTALAAKQVADNKDKTVAAIASGETAELFGLKILASRINESDTNTTHFAVLSRSKDDTPPQNIDGRFTLMFTVRNEAGSLARAVNIIGTHGFNMRTLRSRPMKDLLWEYYFYVECEGIISSPDGMRCLRELEVCCSKLKVLGEYKMIAYTKPDRKA